MTRLFGLLAIIPFSLLLTLSFFVLFALSKVNSNPLKAFGKVIAVLLWLSATLFLLIGSYTVITGEHPMLRMHRQMMKEMMHKQRMMQQDSGMESNKMMPPEQMPHHR